jgi:hypothetical protein
MLSYELAAIYDAGDVIFCILAKDLSMKRRGIITVKSVEDNYWFQPPDDGLEESRPKKYELSVRSETRPHPAITILNQRTKALSAKFK